MDEPCFLLSSPSLIFFFSLLLEVIQGEYMAPISGPCSLLIPSLSRSASLSDAGLNVACVNSARGLAMKESSIPCGLPEA